jgi:microcystin-dependent protein
MAQHDMVVDNADGLTVRTDFNAAMQALVSCNSGVTEPPNKFPGMLWLDLSVAPDGVLRQRDQANSAWLPVLLPPDFRFPQADMFFGARTSPNRLVINDKFDGSGIDLLALRDDGLLTLAPQPGGLPAAPGDVVTKGYVDTIGVPVGTVIYVAMASIPASYLKANGASLLRADYPALFAALGTLYGAVDSSHFNIPDLRGEFIRGWDDGRGLDASRVLGSVQASDFASHTHTATSALNNANHAHTFSDSSSSTSSAGAHTHPIGGSANVPDEGGWSYRNAGNSTSVMSGSAGAHTHTVAVSGTTGLQNANHSHAITVNAAGGADTRPRNVSQLACIKYQ